MCRERDTVKQGQDVCSEWWPIATHRCLTRVLPVSTVPPKTPSVTDDIGILEAQEELRGPIVQPGRTRRLGRRNRWFESSSAHSLPE